MAKTMLAISLLVGAGACSSPAPTTNPTTTLDPTTTTEAPTTTELPATTTTTEAVQEVEEAPITVPTTRARSAPTTAVYKPSEPTVHDDGPVVAGDVWWQLALCESGGVNVDTGNGYSGYFQFLDSTWRSVGYGGRAVDYGYETQVAAAQTLQARSGWGQWPACSSQLGLR